MANSINAGTSTSENSAALSNLYDVNKKLKDFWPNQLKKVREMDVVRFLLWRIFSKNVQFLQRPFLVDPSLYSFSPEMSTFSNVFQAKIWKYHLGFVSRDQQTSRIASSKDKENHENWWRRQKSSMRSSTAAPERIPTQKWPFLDFSLPKNDLFYYGLSPFYYPPGAASSFHSFKNATLWRWLAPKRRYC